MKLIQPVQMWHNGNFIEANAFLLVIQNGILFKNCVFQYTFFNITDNNILQLQQSQIEMSGQDYADWSNDDEYAYNWAASKLNIVIEGDYVPPVTNEVIS